MAGAGRCASCGAELPAGASFCPRCGASVGSVPVIPLVGEGPGDASSGEPSEGSSRSARTVAGVVLGVLAVVVGLSLFAGGDDGAEDDAAPTSSSTTSTTRQRTTTTRPRATTTTVPGEVPPLLADGLTVDGHGTAVVAVTPEGIVAVDPSTGTEVVLGAPDPEVEVRHLQWTGDVLVASGAQRIWWWADDGWREVELGDRRVDWIDPSGTVLLAGEGPVPDLGAVRPDGTLEVLEAAAATWGSGGAIGMVSEGAVFSTFDGIFLAGRDGPRRIASGRLLDVAGDVVLRHSCDDTFECRVSLGRIRNGELVDETVLDPLPVAAELWSGSASPDGRSAWVAGWDPSVPEELTWVGGADGWVDLPLLGPGRESTQWSADGRALFWIDQLTALRVAEIGSGGEPSVVGLDRGRLRSGDMGWLVAFVPLDVLPFGG
ncbi:zinc ribbon domain-containing protein [Actinomarinicola tropica]|uniref:Zinc-ribbon domain-containing protein n=1 Tax=Actinomarinicola tropica TaxID=2789776 RepID=A0A5Q2RQQ3_9ACTN|nr:zinc ribbon domain-containing protein [Actinomarinicola tropica]QGG95525.1 zinc-ribbon domain-containing protein [Actinomarinicola tropica]